LVGLCYIIGMKVNKDIILLYMPEGGQAGLIQAWYQGDHAWVEFRGPAYTDWGVHNKPSPMEIIHDSLLGMHCTVLHQDQILAVKRDMHSDFAAVEQLLLAEKELIFQRPTDAVSL